jgi:hypothetical protein
MEDKLKELIGQSNVWLYIESSKGWVKNAEILEVANKTVTFRYEHESESEKRTWEKTTRVKKEDTQVTALKGRLSNLLGQE